jgi:hypothetical protein
VRALLGGEGKDGGEKPSVASAVVDASAELLLVALCIRAPKRCKTPRERKREEGSGDADEAKARSTLACISGRGAARGRTTLQPRCSACRIGRRSTGSSQQLLLSSSQGHVAALQSFVPLKLLLQLPLRRCRLGQAPQGPPSSLMGSSARAPLCFSIRRDAPRSACAARWSWEQLP